MTSLPHAPYKLVIVAPDRARYHTAIFELGAIAKEAGATPPAVLSPWEAAEWTLPTADRNDELLAAAGDLSIDFALAPSAGQRKSLLVCDMDSTIIGCECIDELADFAGKKAEISAITERAMRGELDFEAALLERVAMLKGLPLRTLQQCYEERVRLNPGAAVLVRTMAANGARCILVSGGFTFFTERVASAAGFHAHFSNRLIHEGDVLAGDVERPILGRDAKRDALLKEAAARAIGPQDAMAIGDGANDLAMIETAGLGVAYRAKPIVAERAAARIDFTSLESALFFQGYRRADFVAGSA